LDLRKKNKLASEGNVVIRRVVICTFHKIILLKPNFNEDNGQRVKEKNNLFKKSCNMKRREKLAWVNIDRRII